MNEQQGTVTCPAARTVPLSRTRVATFGALCRDCPLRGRCTTCKAGREIVLHPRDDLLRAARAGWSAGRGMRKDYRTHRPNVERPSHRSPPGGDGGSSSATAGRRRITPGSSAAAALNLRNLLSKGLTRCDGAWALAT